MYAFLSYPYGLRRIHAAFSWGILLETRSKTKEEVEG
jgi:hypothetical protein